MKLVTPKLIVEEDDAFKSDALERQAFGEALLNIIDRSSDELVIALDGKWGEGKTTFIKMWQGFLKQKEFHSVYIDSFANDYVDDAFIVIASAITEYLDKNIEKSKKDSFEVFKEKSKEVGVSLLSWSTKLAIKAATLGVIKDSDIEELQDIKSDVSKGISSLVGELVEEKLASHNKEVGFISSFRELLSAMPKKLSNNNDKPLVIIIDELDRCKPTFAVEIIEKIKHIFSVKNIIFVLVMNKEQLEASISSVYGNNIDAHTYLQKFISLETTIPKKLSQKYANDLTKYIHHLSLLYELNTWATDNRIEVHVEALAFHFNLSLRELEKVFTNLVLFYGSRKEGSLDICELICFLSVIRVKNPKVFEELLFSRISYEQLIEKVGFKNLSSSKQQGHILVEFREWLCFCLLDSPDLENLPEEQSHIRSYGNYLRRYRINREDVIPYFAQLMSMFLVKI